jgi:hypothetical protein
MRRIEIPRHYYAAKLPDSSATDAIEVEVEAPASGARGMARLKLWPHSTVGLTNLQVSVSAPRCIIAVPSASPRPPDLTASLPGTPGRCAWRHRLSRRSEPVTYEVPFTTSDKNTLRFEFRLRADELKRPVVLTVDLVMAEAQTSGVEAQPVKEKEPVAEEIHSES